MSRARTLEADCAALAMNYVAPSDANEDGFSRNIALDRGLNALQASLPSLRFLQQT